MVQWAASRRYTVVTSKVYKIWFFYFVQYLSAIAGNNNSNNLYTSSSWFKMQWYSFSNFIFMKGFNVISKEDRKKQQERKRKKEKCSSISANIFFPADPFHQIVHQAFNTLYATFTVSWFLFTRKKKVFRLLLTFLSDPLFLYAFPLC